LRFKVELTLGSYTGYLGALPLFILISPRWGWL